MLVSGAVAALCVRMLRLLLLYCVDAVLVLDITITGIYMMTICLRQSSSSL
jgi:hypothetical protein